MAGTPGCSLLFVIILLISTVSGVIEISFVRGVPRLNNSLYCDYYFACHTEGETLQWIVGSNSLSNYFGNSTTGSVFYGSVSNCNYAATLLSLKPLSFSQSFKSALILTCQSNFSIPVICSDGFSVRTINIPEKELSLMAETTNNSIYLEHVLSQNLVNADNSTCTNVFVCGVNNSFMTVHLGNAEFFFTELDSIGRERNEVQDTSVQQAILIDKEPYSLVVAMFIVGDEVMNVTCDFSQNILSLSSMQCRPVITMPMPETTGIMESESSTEGESSTVASGSSSTLPLILGLIITSVVLVAIIIIFIVCGFFIKRERERAEREKRERERAEQERRERERAEQERRERKRAELEISYDPDSEKPLEDFSGIKKPKNRMSNITYDDFFKRVQYIFLTRNENTFNAATTILAAPDVEKTNDQRLTSIDEGVYIGMIGQHQVCLVNETENNFVKKLQKVIIEYFPNAKYLVFVGRCFGIDKTKLKLADIVISKRIRHVTEHRKYTERIAPEIRSKFCFFSDEVEGLQVTKDRKAKHLVAKIASGVNILENYDSRAHALINSNEIYGCEETSGELLSVFKTGINMGNNTTKHMQVIAIGAVSGYADMNTVTPYDEWQFMASRAAFHYVSDKMKHPHHSGNVSYEIKVPMSMQSNIDYKKICSCVQYMILTMGQDEFHAATTTISALDIEGKSYGITQIDDYVYIGMIGNHPVGLFHCRNALKYLKILQQAVNHFPNTKYLLGLGGCGGTSYKKAELADVLISKEILEITYDEEGYSQTVHDMTQEIKDIFCENPCNVDGLELPGNRRAKHLVVRIASGRMATNQYIRELAIKDPQSYGFEEIGGDMLRFQANMSQIGKSIHVILICGIHHYGGDYKYSEWHFVASQAAFNYVAAKIKILK